MTVMDRNVARDMLQQKLCNADGYLAADMQEIINNCDSADDHEPKGVVCAVLDAMIDFAALRQAEAAPGVVEAVKAEIERQCGIGAGTCKRDPETGLIEVHADIDANGFAEAMTFALARQHGATDA